MSYENQIRAFEENLINEEKATATIEKYIRDVHRFNEYVGTRELSKDIVIAYKKELIDNEVYKKVKDYDDRTTKRGTSQGFDSGHDPRDRERRP